MENKDIHSSFEDKAIRDFLSKSYEEGYTQSRCSSADRLKKQIAELQKELDGAIKSEAALELIHKNGWNVYDVSDDIIDYNSSTFMPFVGTEEEYNKILVDIKP